MRTASAGLTWRMAMITGAVGSMVAIGLGVLCRSELGGSRTRSGRIFPRRWYGDYVTSLRPSLERRSCIVIMR